MPGNGFTFEAISLVVTAKLRVQPDTNKRYLKGTFINNHHASWRFSLVTTSVVRLEKTCAFKDFSTLRALPCDQSQTQTLENRHQSPRESAADSCQGSFASEEGKKSDSFSGLHRSRHRCIASIWCAGPLAGGSVPGARSYKKPLEISPPGAGVPRLTTNPLSSR